MAEIVVTLVVEEMLKKLVSLAHEGIDLALGLKGKLLKLNKSLTSIRAVLHDAEEKQGREESVKIWLQKLRDVAYEAEDVLDEFGYEVLRQKVEGITPRSKVSNFFSASSNPIAFRLHMGKNIKKINDELVEIKNEVAGLGLIIGRERAPQTSVSPVTHRFLDKSEQVLGRDSDVSQVINLLTVSSDDQVLSVVPIVGMGGLGKTTLAKLVVKEIENRKLFDKTIWVCVSQSFNEQIILGEILENLSAGTNIGGWSNLDTIVGQLTEKLQGKKFLLVLDDVWNEEIDKWERLKKDLSIVSGRNGNVIIVTTRKHQTASIIETSPTHRHKLKGLQDEECWSIIREIVESGNDKASISENLEVLGKDIAKKCGGVPLAARMLGGLMRNSKEERYWLSIKNNHVLDSVGNDTGILPILKLSFDHLSWYLKPCFAYCAMFPEDHRIDKEQLIQLWMAQGLLGTANDRSIAPRGIKCELGSAFKRSKGSGFEDVFPDAGLWSSGQTSFVVVYVGMVNRIPNTKLLKSEADEEIAYARNIDFRFVILCSGFHLQLGEADHGSINCPSLQIFASASFRQS
ncbi:hypothetical protein Tsubulata_016068 [Turnera subulata]|uniref:Disease resistance protein RGA3 n=1 Tax=Turnera subulata TaxID=218843 RepID=A0A9Q0F706_9ROSI|nr:hypothetical protein Tsubulata_016068 [Turnera subulata]